jgi:hypothetical protein
MRDAIALDMSLPMLYRRGGRGRQADIGMRREASGLVQLILPSWRGVTVTAACPNAVNWVTRGRGSRESVNFWRLLRHAAPSQARRHENTNTA